MSTENTTKVFTEEDTQEASAANTKSYANAITQQYDNYIQQSQNNIDNQVKLAEDAATRSYEDTIEDYQKQYREATTSMYTQMDNQALMSRANGQFGGMATASVGAIQSDYQKARQEISLQQQKLATDTVREIADLRAQGEFDKADALLQARQQEFQALYDDAVRVDENQYSNEQWQTAIDRDDAAILREQEQNELDYMRNMGQAFLSVGVMPSTSMLNAMGIDTATAQLYINAVKAGY